MRFDIGYDMRLVKINEDTVVNLPDIAGFHRYSGGTRILLRGGGFIFAQMSVDDVIAKLGKYPGVTVKRHG